MASSGAKEFNRSLVIALAAAFVVIAVVAIIVYTPAARTGQFHGAEQVVSVTWARGEYYDFDAMPPATQGTTSPSGQDVKLQDLRPDRQVIDFSAGRIDNPSTGANTDCSSLPDNAGWTPNTLTIYKDVGWPADHYICVRTSAGSSYLVNYHATDATSSFDWVKQGVCGDGFVQSSPNFEQCDDSNTNNGDGCSSTCQIEPETDCFDKIDNNNNGQTDCRDPGCASQPGATIAHGSVRCSGSSYRYACDNNFDNCDNDVLTGCEADLTSASTCGSCTTHCTAGQTCTSGACVSPSDSTLPTVSITSQTDGATVSGTITITASADDNVGVAGVQFQVDTSNIGSEDTSQPYFASLDTTTLSNGAHTITVIASDAAGNQNSNAISVTVSNAPGCSYASTCTPTTQTICSGTTSTQAQTRLTLCNGGCSDWVNSGSPRACLTGQTCTGGVCTTAGSTTECAGDPKPVLTISPTAGSSGQITPTVNPNSLTGNCPGKTISIHAAPSCADTLVSSCQIQSAQTACNPAAFTVPDVTTTYYLCLDVAGVVSDGVTFTAPPTVTATHNIQGTVATITADANNQQATNIESKIKEITIFVDNTLAKTCAVSPVAAAATCQYSGTYSTGSTHAYYGKAKNNADLEGQSSPQGSFTIPANANQPSITNIQTTPPLNPNVATTISWTAANVNHYEITYTTDTTKECKEEDVGTDGSVCGGGTSGWNCVQSHIKDGSIYSSNTVSWVIPSVIPSNLDSKDVQIRIEGHNGGTDLHKVAVNACKTVTITRSGTAAGTETGQPCTQAGQQLACYSGARGTKDAGVCKGGIRTCYQNNKTWSACVGEIIPSAEACDGLDNNCNFAVDEAVVNGQTVASGACNTPDKCGANRVDCTKSINVKFGEPVCQPGQNNAFVCGLACLNGFAECGGSCFRDNGNGQCVASQWTCNSGSAFDPVANECAVKESCAGLPASTGQQCYTGPASTENIGECNAGYRTCGADHFWSICSGQAWPAAEVCDGRDNDCDGIVDNFLGRGAGSACPGATNCGPQKIDCNQIVAGKNADSATCISNQCKVLTCTLGWQDKDGKVENGCETRLTGCIDPDKDGYGAPNTDLSKCAKSKTAPDCDSTNAVINPGMNETCNSKDDNCNGIADENILETRSCGLGVCAGGEQTRTCEAGESTEWTDCSTAYLAGTESATVCNALDDDCNGILDDPFDFDKDGFPANVTACAAAYITAGKGLDCNDKDKFVFPGANETCNGIDNDCNGVIDDFLGSEDPEETLCACSGLTASEVKLQKKEVEEINGIDDNCDGRLDPKESDSDGDGFTPDQGDCDDKKADVNPDASELCSTKYDDNCDGKINEGCAAAAPTTTARNVSILELAFGTTPKPITPPATPSLPEVTEEIPTAPEAPAENIPTEEVPASGESVPAANKPNTTLLVSIISLVAAALGGALWFVRTKMKANVSAEAEAFGIGGPEETELGDVKDFVSSSMAQGHPAAAVKDTLKGKGWQGSDIDNALEETAGDIEKLGGMAEKQGLTPDQDAGIKRYISGARAGGFSDAQIKAALVNGGWDARTVEKYL